MKNEDKKSLAIKIPYRLVSSVELSRLIRELKMLDDWLLQAQLRSGGQAVKTPKTSVTLEETATLNGVSLLESDQREAFLQSLVAFAESAPKIHMSFAVEPSAQFLNHMIVWLRTNINPSLLLEVGLQPTLAAGSVVRTTNKMLDLSLRNRFVDSRPLLVQSIAKFQQRTPQAETVTAQPTGTEQTASTSSQSQPQQASAAPSVPSKEVAPAAEAVTSSQPEPQEAKS